jgi:hypothetical protein
VRLSRPARTARSFVQPRHTEVPRRCPPVRGRRAALNARGIGAHVAPTTSTASEHRPSRNVSGTAVSKSRSTHPPFFPKSRKTGE